jgi:hypothetical protein
LGSKGETKELGESEKEEQNLLLFLLLLRVVVVVVVTRDPVLCRQRWVGRGGKK